MGLDLGSLSVTIRVNTDEFHRSLQSVRRELEGVGHNFDALDKKSINPQADSSEVEKTGKSAEDAGKKLDAVGKKTVKPKADTSEVDKAKSSTEQLSSKLGEVDGKRVRPDVDKQPIEDATTATRGLMDSLGAIAAKGVKWGAVTAGAAAIGGIGTAITKGFSRLDSIDQATAKLEALGNSGVDVREVMDNALASVKGTSFGIGEAAGTAAVLVGAGVKPGQEMERTLKLVADSAAIAGIGFDEMGAIWGKVASNTVLSGEEMAQISDRSIGLQVALGEQMGVTALEAKKMVSEGKVSFEDFEQAMESLVGGGAQRMGDTISGAMDNVGAAMGRAGANFLEGGMSEAPDLLKELTTQIDLVGGAVGPLGSQLSSSLAPALSDVISNLGPTALGGINALNDVLGVAAPLAGTLADALGKIPFPVVAGGIAALVAQHKGWNTQLADGGTKVGDFAKRTVGSMGSVIRSFDQAYDRGSSRLRGVANNHALAAEAARKQSLTTKDVFTSIDHMGQSMARGFAANATHMGASAKGLASGGVAVLKSGFDGAKNAAGGLMSALGGPWGVAIMAAGAAIAHFASEHRKAAEAELEHKAAQAELKGTLDATTGAVTAQTEAMLLKRAEESGWLQTAVDMGLAHSDVSAAMIGNTDAIAKMDTAVGLSSKQAVEATDYWQKWGTRLSEFGVEAGDIAGRLNGNAEATERVTSAMQEINKVDPNLLAGHTQDLAAVRDELTGTTSAAWEMRDGFVGAAGDLNEIQVEEAKNQILELEKQVETTKDVLASLGDAAFKLEGKHSLSVEATPETLELRDQLEEIEGITTQTMNGRLHIDFAEGLDVLAVLDEIGIKLEKTPEGFVKVNAEDAQAAAAFLDDLGLKTTTLPGGELGIDTNAPEVLELMYELGMATKDEMTGEIVIDDGDILTSDELMNALRENVGMGAAGHAEVTDNNADVENRTNSMRDNVAQGAKGAAIMQDNSHVVAQNIDNNLQNKETRGTHRITTITTFTSGFGGTGGSREFADGGLVDYFAEGGVREDHVAQIAPAGSWRVWAEPETGGEAYIPLADSKRGRSLAIMNEVADRFGMAMIDKDAMAFEDGGILASERVKQELAPYDGTPYVFGGWGPSGTDCSGAVSMAVNSYLGLDPFDSRTATMSQGQWLEAKGFQRGQGGDGDVRVAYMNGGPGGGHTAMQLPDGTYIESGGNTGGGLTIGGPAGPLEGRGFTDWYYLPGTGGDTAEAATGGNGSYTTVDGFGLSGGGGRRSYGRSGGGGSGVTKTVNGGHGSYFEDGSFLELMAAIYAKQTGSAMPDDVVSWGNVMGMGTRYEGEDLDRQLRDAEREQRQMERDHEGDKRSLEQARADLREMREELDKGGKETGSGKNKKFEAWSEDDRAERERKILDQQDKILDMEDSLEEYADRHAELIESQDKLRMAIEKVSAEPVSIAQSLGVTPMADGGILGGLGRQAQIQDGSSAVLWAEAGEEAYIPLANGDSARNRDIWLEAGKRLGYDVAGLLNMIGSGLAGLPQGDLSGVNTGGSLSVEGLGLNAKSVSYRGAEVASNAVGAQFYGPVQINDPAQWTRGQLHDAQKLLGQAMKGMR